MDALVSLVALALVLAAYLGTIVLIFWFGLLLLGVFGCSEEHDDEG